MPGFDPGFAHPHGLTLNGQVKRPPIASGPTRSPDTVEADRTSHGTVVGMQRFLISQGYRLEADGQMGPKTKAALHDFHSGVKNRNPEGFNKRFAPVVPATGIKSPAHTGPATGVTTHPVGGGGQRTPASPFGTVDASFIDPAAYAHGEVNAAYNPIISELVRQRQGYEAQEKPNLGNIQDWYGTALEEARAATKADAAGFDHAEGQNKALALAIQNALGGGDAAAGAAEFSQVGQNHLAELGAGAHAFDVGRQANTAQAGAEAQIAEHTRLAGLQKDLAGQILDQKGAKGAAYGKSLTDANDLLMRQQVAKQNADFQAAQFPLDLETKRAALAQSKTAAADEHEGNLQTLAQNKIQLKLLRDSAKPGGTIPDFGKLDPGKRMDLRKELVQSALKADGSPAYTPQQAYNAWGNALRGASGGKWNPFKGKSQGAQQFRDNLLQEYIVAWNASNPKKQVKFVPGKGPVRI